MASLMLVSYFIVSVAFSPDLWKHKLHRNKKPIPRCVRVANIGETLKSGLVGVWVGLKLHELGSVLMRLMLADSLYGHSLLSNRASGLRHYFHLSKGKKIEKRGTRQESRLHQMSRLRSDTKVFCGHKPG